MNEFFTWAALGTCAGATLVVTLITQLLKEVPGIQKMPTRLFSYGVAVVVLFLAAVFSGNLTVDNAVLCFINGVVVSLASNGAFDAVAKKTE